MPKTKVAINKGLIKQAVLAMQANIRQSTAHTKTRGQVSGGGRKPWKQKGTGRARVGSSRSPIWVGGGVTFGPTKDRNFKQALPKKMAMRAKAQLWQLLAEEKRVLTTPKLHLAEPKTKLAVKLLKDISVKGKTLLITKTVEPELILATANLQAISVKPLDQVSILDLAYFQTLVMEQVCFDEVYASAKPAKAPKKAKAEVEKEAEQL